MELSPNLFLQKLHAQQQQVGIWVSMTGNVAAEVIAHSQFDWFLIDMEHAPNDYQSVYAQLQVFSANTAVVRPDWNDPIKIKRLLDIGANNLLFPMVQSVAEAKKAVAATRYPPIGIRGVSVSTRAAKYGRVENYLQSIHNNIAVIVQLETKHALEQAEEIADVEGVSAVFFGPSDIAADLGLLGQPMHDDVWNLIMPIAKKLIAKGIAVGTLVLDPLFAKKLLSEGFSMVACAMDSDLLAKASDTLIAQIK